MAAALLQSFNGGPVQIQLGNGRVVNLRSTTDKEHELFVVGRFQALAHPDGGRGLGGDLHQVQPAQTRVLRVVPEGVQRGLGDSGQLRVTFADPPLPAGREYVLAVDDGVHDQAADVTDLGADEEALNHVAPMGPMVVCEGLHTARALARATELLAEVR